MPPPNKPYIQNAYRALKENLEGFNKSPEDFERLVLSDKIYRGKVYTALKENLEGFNKSDVDFDSAIGVAQTKSAQPIEYPKSGLSTVGGLLQPAGTYKPVEIEGSSTNMDGKPLISASLPKMKETVKGNIQSFKGAQNIPQTMRDNSIAEETTNRKAAASDFINTAVDNTTKRRLAAKGIKFKAGDVNYKKEAQAVRKLKDSGDLDILTDREGNPQLVRSQGVGESILNAAWESLKEPVRSFKTNTTSNPKELADLFDEEEAEKPIIPESNPNEFGQMIGGVIKPAAELAIPYIGTGMMVGEQYFNSIANQRRELYFRGMQEGLPREQAAELAIANAGTAAIPDAITAYALSRVPAKASVVPDAAIKSFSKTLANTAQGAAKMGGLFGGAEVARAGIQKSQGYNVTLQEAFDKGLQGVSDGVKMDIGLKVAFGLPNTVKVVKSAAKEVLSHFKTDEISQRAKLLGLDPAEVKANIAEYQEVRNTVKDLVPEEQVPFVTGLVQKQRGLAKEVKELEDSKLTVPEALHDKIDDQIRAKNEEIKSIDGRVAKMAKSDEPIEHEVDDATGAKVVMPEEMNRPEEVLIGQPEPKVEEKRSPSILLPENNKEPNIIDLKTDQNESNKPIEPVTEGVVETKVGDEPKPTIEIVNSESIVNENSETAKESAIGQVDYNGIFSTEISSISNKGKGTKEILRPTETRQIVMMSPDEYLKLVREGLNTNIINLLKKGKGNEQLIEKYEKDSKEGVDENINDTSKKVIQDAVNKGDKLDMPFVFFNEAGKMIDQDGRNRATYAKAIGEELIPVLIENKSKSKNEGLPNTPDTGTTAEVSTPKDASEPATQESIIEATAQGDTGGTKPPDANPTAPILDGNNEQWSSIRKEKLAEIDKVKQVFEKENKTKWSEVQQQGLEKVAQEHPDKTLYEATKAKTQELADKYDRKEDYNPTAKDLAVVQEFKRQTEKKINQAKDRLSSDDDVVRRIAALDLENYANDLTDVGKALFTREAGTAFGYRQSETLVDADYPLQLRRMQIMKAQGWEKLSTEQETWVNDAWKKEKELLIKENELREKGMQESFEKKLQEVKNEYEAKLKDAGKNTPATKREKTLSQKGKDVADKLRKLKTKKGDIKLDITLGTWNLAVEGIARLVEGGATIAEAIDQLIKEKSLGFKTDGDKEKFENELIKFLDNSDKRDGALSDIKAMATELNATDVTPEMVGKGFIADFVNSHIGEFEQKDVLSAATNALREVLPDLTKTRLIEAYLKEGEFKQSTKKELAEGLSAKKRELQSIAKLEEDISDLEGIKDVRQRNFPTERERSEYEKELLAKKQSLINEQSQRRAKIIDENTKLESERNRQLKKVEDLKAKRDKLKQGIIEKTKKTTVADTPEIESLKKEVKLLEQNITKAESEKKKAEDRIVAERNAQIKRDNLLIEREVNRQMKRVTDLETKKAKLEQGIIEKKAKSPYKPDTPEIEKLKQQVKSLEEGIRKAEADKKTAADKIARDRKSKIRKDNDKLTTEINRQNRRISELKERKDKLDRGIREKRPSTKKQDTPEIEALKKQVQETDKWLREAESEAQRITEEQQERKDKLGELNANINRAKKGLEQINTYKKKSTAQLDAEIDAKRRELKKAIQEHSTDEQKQAEKLKNVKKKIISDIKELKRKIAEGDYSDPPLPTALKHTDAELIRLQKEHGMIEAMYKKKQRELQEKNKGRSERMADLVRNMYVTALIGAPKTLAKVGAMSVMRPFSEAVSKGTLGKVFDAFFPNISKAAKVGGESSSVRSIAAGFGAYFKQMGEAKIKAKIDKSNKELEDASKKYTEYENGGNVDPKELARLKTEVENRQLDVLGNLVYEFIGGSSLKDSMKALTKRANIVEQKFGGIEEESIRPTEYDPKRANWKQAIEAEAHEFSYIMNFIGRSHSALKTFSGRFSFAAGFMARAEAAVRKGELLTSDRLLEMGHESYLDFERGKYQQENAITRWWNRMINATLLPDTKHPEWNKTNKALYQLSKGDVAITRVPVNIFHEAVMEYTMGTFRAIYMAAKEVGLAKKAAKLEGLTGGEFEARVKQMVSSMDAKQAATIARCFRKGGIGLGMYAFAAFSGMIHFGGYQFLGQRRKKEEDDLDLDELNPAQVEVGGAKMGEVASGIIEHIPALWTMFMGAGMAYTYNAEIEKGKTTKEAAEKSLMNHLKVMEGGIPQFKVISPIRVGTGIMKVTEKRLTESGLVDEDEEDTKKKSGRYSN